MPNWVTSKIEFEVPSEEEARQIYDTICIDNEFDFRILGPLPFKIYGEALGLQDPLFETSGMEKEERFFSSESLADLYEHRKAGEISALEWLEGKAAFSFQTAYIAPYPVIVAFGNKFKVSFTHTYIDENFEFWGIEKFDLNEDGFIERTSERKCIEDDLRDLQLDFIGYVPEEDREDTQEATIS